MTNGGSSRDSSAAAAAAAAAPSSVPLRSATEENSSVQLSGESEERYKLRMQRLDRISSKLHDKEEEIKKQREKEVSEWWCIKLSFIFHDKKKERKRKNREKDGTGALIQSA